MTSTCFKTVTLSQCNGYASYQSFCGEKNFERKVDTTASACTTGLPKNVHAWWVMTMLNRMTLGTAAGYDNIHPEFLKHLDPLAIAWLTRLFTRMLQKQKIPKTCQSYSSRKAWQRSLLPVTLPCRCWVSTSSCSNESYCNESCDSLDNELYYWDQIKRAFTAKKHVWSCYFPINFHWSGFQRCRLLFNKIWG